MATIDRVLFLSPAGVDSIADQGYIDGRAVGASERVVAGRNINAIQKLQVGFRPLRDAHFLARAGRFGDPVANAAARAAADQVDNQPVPHAHLSVQTPAGNSQVVSPLEPIYPSSTTTRQSCWVETRTG